MVWLHLVYKRIDRMFYEWEINSPPLAINNIREFRELWCVFNPLEAMVSFTVDGLIIDH